MMDMQAVVGIHQLKRIDDRWREREKRWNIYIDAFGDLNAGLPAAAEKNTPHAYRLFTARIYHARVGISRDKFLEAMTGLSIGVGIHYLSIPEHPYYRKTFSWIPQDYLHAQAFGRETVSLFVSPKLTDQDVDDVISAVRAILTKRK